MTVMPEAGFSLLTSDLHLSPAQPHVTHQFGEFLRRHAGGAHALYLLGDLFEYWLGDDTLDAPLAQQIIAWLAELSTRGTQVYLMHGNRDFLIGTEFARRCGARLLDDPCLINLHGTPTLLSHGDSLCTDDLPYQAFRRQVRHPVWQAQFLALPVAERIAQAETARRQSEAAQQEKSAAIMDVNLDAVHALLRAHGYPRLIHGHTHRPARHSFELDNHACERWVLPDWSDTRNGWLRCDAGGCSFEQLA